MQKRFLRGLSALCLLTAFVPGVWGGSSARAADVTTTDPQPVSSVGNAEALVLLVDFDDTAASRPNIEIRNLFFGSPQDAPNGSVTQVYTENSYGKLKLNGVVLGNPRGSVADNPDPTLQVKWIRLPHEYSWYANNQYGEGAAPQNSLMLVKDALRAVDRLYPDFDWKQFDQNNDGFVDILYIFHAGLGVEATLDPSQINSHQSQLDSDYTLGAAGSTPVKVRRYALGAEFNGPSVPAHEIGHVFGLPDLYTNPQGQSIGLGQWSMMAFNYTDFSTDAPFGAPDWFNTLRPPQFDPWSKIQLGWITPTVITKSVKGVSLPPVELSPTVLKIPNNPENPQEYYLVENRGRLEGTYDAPATIAFTDALGQPQTAVAGGIPGSGVMIYHVDERRGTNDDRGHLLVEVQEADAPDVDKKTGLVNGFNLLYPDGHPLSNFGDSGDPFGTTHHTFTNLTTPNTINYSGDDSGVRITAITVPPVDATTGIVSRTNDTASMDIVVASIIGQVFTATGEKLPAFTLQLLSPSGQVIANPALQTGTGQFTISDLDQGNYILQLNANGYIPQLIPVVKQEGPTRVRAFLVKQPGSSAAAVGWNILTFPEDFGGAKVSDVLGMPDVVAYAWNGIDYVANPTVTPGQAYWIYFTDPTKFIIALPGVAVTPDTDFNIPVHIGWNLIGNPFPRAIVWDPSQIKIQPAGTDPINLDQAQDVGAARNFAWAYRNDLGDYELIRRGDPVRVNMGFWYFSNVEGTLTMPAPVALPR